MKINKIFAALLLMVVSVSCLTLSKPTPTVVAKPPSVDEDDPGPDERAEVSASDDQSSTAYTEVNELEEQERAFLAAHPLLSSKKSKTAASSQLAGLPRAAPSHIPEVDYGELSVRGGQRGGGIIGAGPLGPSEDRPGLFHRKNLKKDLPASKGEDPNDDLGKTIPPHGGVGGGLGSQRVRGSITPPSEEPDMAQFTLSSSPSSPLSASKSAKNGPTMPIQAPMDEDGASPASGPFVEPEEGGIQVRTITSSGDPDQ